MKGKETSRQDCMSRNMEWKLEREGGREGGKEGGKNQYQ